MKVVSFLFSLMITFVFSQNKIVDNQISCDSIELKIRQMKADFVEHPSCEKYYNITSEYIGCHVPLSDIEIMYVAATQCQCVGAYNDLYQFYFHLNEKISKQLGCEYGTLLLENLDVHSRKFAIEMLLKSKHSLELPAYYYYGIYVKEDRKKAVQLLKMNYDYVISDGEVEQKLKGMKNDLTPCSKGNK